MNFAGAKLVGVSYVVGVGSDGGLERAVVPLVQVLDAGGPEGDTRVGSRRAQVGQRSVESLARRACVAASRASQFFRTKRDVRVDDRASPTGLELQLMAAKVHVLESAEANPADDQRQRGQSADGELESAAERPWQPAGYPPRRPGAHRLSAHREQRQSDREQRAERQQILLCPGEQVRGQDCQSGQPLGHGCHRCLGREIPPAGAQHH